MPNKKTKESKFLDLKNINKNTEAIVYYGFLPIETPQIEKEDIDRGKSLKESDPIITIGTNKNIENTIDEKSAILRNYFNSNMAIMPQPVMIAYDGFIEKSSTLTHGTNKKKSSGKHQKIGLEIIGSPKSISEAIIIKTILAILEDNDFKDLYVEINSIGDRESTSRFLREITAYFRKNINTMQAHCRQAFKKDPFLVFSCQDDKCRQLIEEAPKSIGCLSDESREHFRGVLEYLESLNIPYKINNCLVSDRRYASGTVFEIKQKSDNPKIPDESLAVGFRSDGVCKKLGFKKDVPTIGAKLFFEIQTKDKQLPKIKKTSVFFIQLGDEAKHKSLKVIDILRKENIYINHSLGRDKLAGQMAMADRVKVPYILIMGKKEAMDDTIMIRDVATRSQETVRISDLATYLKKLVK